jgi:hypothetical protein
MRREIAGCDQILAIRAGDLATVKPNEQTTSINQPLLHNNDSRSWEDLAYLGHSCVACNSLASPDSCEQASYDDSAKND